MPPPTTAPNPFDQFDPPASLPPLPPGAKLDPPAAPGRLAYGPDLLAGTSAPVHIPALPPGAKLDAALPPGYVLDPPTRQQGHAPNPFDQFDPPAANSPVRWGAALLRGGLEGLTGLADITTAPLARGVNDITRAVGLHPAAAMIAAGKSGQGELDQELGPQGFNVAQPATAGQRIAEGVAGAVAPTVATMGLGEGLGAIAGAGRAAQAVRGVGQLLSGSKGLQLASAATGGAANVAGQEAGMSPQDAALLGLGASFVPGGAMAARAGVANAARGAFLDSIGRTMTPDEAAETVRAGTALSGYQAGGATMPQAAAAYGSDLNAAVGQYRRAGQAAGYFDADDGRAIGQAAAQANAGSTAPGTATAGVRALALPGYHQDAVQGAVGQLDALSRLPTGGAAVGPLSSAVAKAAPVAAGLSAIGAAHGGDWLHAAELAGGAYAGRTVASPMLRLAGTVGDRLLGTSMSPAEARLAAAQRVIGRTGMDASGDPLGDLQAAVADAQGTVQDDRLNAADDAMQAARMAQQDAAWKANAGQQQAAEAAWQKAMAQRDRQNAAGQPDPLSSFFWQQAEQAQAPNLSAVTASQARGFQADQAGLARRDAQETAADAAQQARGLNLSEQAGAWLERQRIGQFKQANPGVPVPGAAALGAQDPRALFQATAGRFGSPVGASDPGVAGVSASAPIAPASGSRLEGPPATPAGSPQGMVPGTAGATPGSLQAPSSAISPGVASSPSLGMLPTGGGALAQAIFRDYHPALPLPSAAELHGAVDDLAADGLIHPQLADHLHAGGNAPDRHVAANIADRVATARGLPSILDPQVQALQDASRQFQQFNQASGEVAQLMGQQGPAAGNPADVQVSSSVPNGTTNGRGPIVNLPRWQAAVGSYRQHAANMMTLAPTPAEKQAIATVAAEPTATGKAAIRDRYLAANPGADGSRFTPQLMRGT